MKKLLSNLFVGALCLGVCSPHPQVNQVLSDSSARPQVNQNLGGFARGFPGSIEPTKPIAFFSQKVLNAFEHLYDRPKELPLCMEGLQFGNNFYVPDVKIPYIIESTDSTAQYKPKTCYTPSYLGTVHNHTNSDGVCGLSITDLARFYNDEKARIESIVCRATGDSMIVYTEFKKSKIKNDVDSVTMALCRRCHNTEFEKRFKS